MPHASTNLNVVSAFYYWHVKGNVVESRYLDINIDASQDNVGHDPKSYYVSDENGNNLKDDLKGESIGTQPAHDEDEENIVDVSFLCTVAV